MTATLNTLTNSYHNTEYRTRRSNDDIAALEVRIYDGTATAADRQFVRAARAALCGSPNCTCGDFLGRRA